MVQEIGSGWFEHVGLLAEGWTWRFSGETVAPLDYLVSPVCCPAFLVNPHWATLVGTVEPAAGHVLFGNFASDLSLVATYEWADPAGTGTWHTIAAKAASVLFSDNALATAFHLPCVPTFRIRLYNASAVNPATVEGCFTLYSL